MPLLQAEQFAATRFDPAQTKADFGNQLLAFIADGFPQKRFTQRFYRVLMQHFGMIVLHLPFIIACRSIILMCWRSFMLPFFTIPAPSSPSGGE